MIQNSTASSCLKSLLVSNEFFSLTEDEFKSLEEFHVDINYNKGDNVIKQGSRASHILFLKKGLVKVYTVHNDIKTILCIEPGGTFIGLAALYGEGTFPYSVTTYEDSEFCMFEVNFFQRLIEKGGSFARLVVHQQNDYINRSFIRTHVLIHKQTQGRFAEIILCLTERIYKSDEFELSLSRKDLSEITAMSVESLSRMIKEFNEDEILRIRDKKLKILDMEKLKYISRTS